MLLLFRDSNTFVIDNGSEANRVWFGLSTVAEAE